MLEQRSTVKRVEVCFLTAAKPSFQDGLEEAKRIWSKASIRNPIFIFYRNINGEDRKSN